MIRRRTRVRNNQNYQRKECFNIVIFNTCVLVRSHISRKKLRINTLPHYFFAGAGVFQKMLLESTTPESTCNIRDVYKRFPHQVVFFYKLNQTVLTWWYQMKVRPAWRSDATVTFMQLNDDLCCFCSRRQSTCHILSGSVMRMFFTLKTANSFFLYGHFKWQVLMKCWTEQQRNMDQYSYHIVVRWALTHRR